MSKKIKKDAEDQGFTQFNDPTKRHPTRDQQAYKECLSQQKRTGSTNPSAVCAAQFGKSYNQMKKDEMAKQENHPKLIGKTPQKKPPNRPLIKKPMMKIPTQEDPAARFPHASKSDAKKSETATIELISGMSYLQLRKMENEALKKKSGK